MTDQDAIQGVWQVISGERSSKPFPDDVVKNARLIFDGERMTTEVKDRSTTFTFRLFPDRSPKAVDLDMDGTIGEGIYELDRDSLTLVHTEAGQPRPAEFVTRDCTPLTLMVLKRAM